MDGLGAQLAIGGGTGCPPGADCAFEPYTPFTVVDGKGKGVTRQTLTPIELRAETAIGTSFVVMTGAQITGPKRNEQPGDAAAFDLATKRWVVLPSARRFTLEPESLTWTGHELIAMSPTELIALEPA